MKKRVFTVTDGKLVLTLTDDGRFGYVVTSPFAPGLVTEAESLDEAFVNARDALKLLKQAAHKKLKRE